MKVDLVEKGALALYYVILEVLPLPAAVPTSII